MAVRLTEVIEKMSLTLLTPEIDVSKIKILQPDINRPAIQLAGYFEHFEATRIQIIGFVEYSYMEGYMTEEQKDENYDRLLSLGLPCVVFCRELLPDEKFLATARKYGVPLLMTPKATSAFTAELIRWLNVQLAPCISIHGVLVDVYGEGVLITGESGIGKSEAALELIKRGHRLVSDDVVEIRKVSDATLVGYAPELTRHLLELRGIGILNIKNMFGVESVKDTMNIDLAITLQEYDKDDSYDRLGLDEQHPAFLGIRVASHTIPIRPGRNIAIIIEGAAVNARAKYMGYNAAQELCDRMNAKLKEDAEGNDVDSNMVKDITPQLREMYGLKKF